MNDWKTKNYDKLLFELGASGDSYQFLNGIMFATSASKVSVLMLQNVIQADAAHMNFGKYTLYSAYGNMVNANMSPVAFAIIFGNEDCAGWTKFWNFAVHIFLLFLVISLSSSSSLSLRISSFSTIFAQAGLLIRGISPGSSKRQKTLVATHPFLSLQDPRTRNLSPITNN